MADVDRNSPKRRDSSDSTYSLMEFNREFAPYRRLAIHGYDHRMIKHGKRRNGTFVYVEGDVHPTPSRTASAFVKGSLRGVYKGVSRKPLQSYLDEFSFRMNHRLDEQPMVQDVAVAL